MIDKLLTLSFAALLLMVIVILLSISAFLVGSMLAFFGIIR